MGDRQHSKRGLVDVDYDEDAPSPDPAVPESSNSSRKKGRTSASGSGSSRGVANLTPAQLEKKRANDREAQRAIRERTKNQIETLERRIGELTSQQPYQELQHVLRQKELVEAENVDIKKRLASVLALIQPVMGQQGLEAPIYAAQDPVFRPNSSPNHQYPPPPNSGHSPSAVSPSQWQAPNAPMGSMGHDGRVFSQGQTVQQIQQLNSQQLNQQRHDLAHNLDMGPERLGLDFLLDGTQRINQIPNGVHGMNGIAPQSNFQQMSRGSDRGSPEHHRSNSATSSASKYNGEVMGHTAPIRNGPPTCPLDSLLLDFLYERQQQAAEGVATPKLVGPAYPSVSSLLNPSRGINSHPLSKVFTDILATFPDLSTLPEKVAVLYIMFLIMRWQIAPTQENYDRLPEWATPRPSQLFTPHPAWIDHLPWPKMRDRLVRDYNPRDYLFDNFFIPFTTTMSVNWPYEPTDALLIGEGDEVGINPVFERHLRRLENWSLGEAFAGAFPGLEGTYRLKLEGDRRI